MNHIMQLPDVTYDYAKCILDWHYVHYIPNMYLSKFPGGVEIGSMTNFFLFVMMLYTQKYIQGQKHLFINEGGNN